MGRPLPPARALVSFTALALLATQLAAETFTDFEADGFVPGVSVHGLRDDGTNAPTRVSSFAPNVAAWSVRRVGVDEEVVDLTADDPVHGKVWRLSDRTATGGLEQRPHSPKMDGQAGETGAVDDFGDEPVTTSTFRARLDFRSATGGPQPGLELQVSPTCGSSCRQAIVRIVDDGAGFDIETFEPGADCRNYLRVLVDLDLSYDTWHTLEIVLTFVDGRDNDVLELLVDGAPVHTGISWERCYARTGPPASVDRLSFGRGSVRRASVGGGLYFDNIMVSDAVQVVDTDGDGVPDDEDVCPESDMSETVVVNGCDSGVPNVLLEDGCTVSDVLADCRESRRNHGGYVRCAAHLLNDLVEDGLIAGRDKGRVQRLVARDRR